MVQALKTEVTACAYKVGDKNAEKACNEEINTARTEAVAKKYTCDRVQVSGFSSEPGAATVLQTLTCTERPKPAKKTYERPI